MKPDWDRIRELGAQVRRLRRENLLSVAAYDRIIEEALVAAHGHGDAIEPFYANAPKEWLERGAGRASVTESVASVRSEPSEDASDVLTRSDHRE